MLSSIVDGLNPEDGLEVDSPEPHAYPLDDLQQTNIMAFLRWQSSKMTIPFHDD